MANNKVSPQSPTPRLAGIFTRGEVIAGEAAWSKLRRSKIARSSSHTAWLRQMRADMRAADCPIYRCSAPRNTGRLITTETIAPHDQQQPHSWTTVETYRGLLALSRKHALQLLKVTTSTDMRAQYAAAALHCSRTVIKLGDTLTRERCRTRSCLLCQAIRATKNAAEYAPCIEKWQSACMLTLTLPTVPADQLPDRIDQVAKAIRKIANRINKRRARNGLPRINYIIGLEATVNERQLKFHYHLHAAFSDYTVAQQFRAEWLSLHPEASPQAQDLRPIDKTGVLEVLKYVVKPYTKDGDLIPADMADVLYQATKGRQSILTAGPDVYRTPITDQQAEDTVTDDHVVQDDPGSALNAPDGVYTWDDAINTWVDHTTGVLLTDKPLTPLTRKRLDSADQVYKRALARYHTRVTLR